MSEERRYADDEVRAIFERATQQGRAEQRSVSNAGGLTLAEIQDIGREVGIDAESLARAAASLETAATATPSWRRTSLRMPIAVGRVVPLARAPTDAEWAQLVAELRATFRARGQLFEQGGIREWVNGNLHAAIEPTGSGYQLRLGTLKGTATPMNALGAGALAFGAIVSVAGLPADPSSGFEAVMLSAGGLAALLSNYVRLPRWAQQRERQMEYIAQRATSIVTADSSTGTDSSKFAM